MSLHGYVFALPLILGFFLIFLWVLISSLQFSFGNIVINDVSYEVQSVGWANYEEILFKDPDFVRAVVDAVIKMVTDIPIIIFFGLFIATLLNQKMKSKAFFRAVFFIPVIIATGVIAKSDAISNFMMNNMASTESLDASGGSALAGGISQITEITNYIRELSFSPQITDFVTGAVDSIYDIINRSGVQILLFLAGIQSVSPSIYEAAKVEGSTGWEEFWKITLPMLSPIVLLNSIYTIIDSFTRPENQIMDMIYKAGFGKASQYGVASAMAWVYSVVMIIIVAAVGLFLSRKVYYEKRN